MADATIPVAPVPEDKGCALVPLVVEHGHVCAENVV